jgi:predicted O-methyltransferase YrrM
MTARRENAMGYENPEEILKLARSFMGASILLTGAELNLFTLLKHQNLAAREIAEQTETVLRPLVILLDALTALGLLVKESDRYRCVLPVSAFLADDAPDTSVLPMVLHLAHLWRRWSALTNIMQGTPDSYDQGHGAQSDDELQAFIGAMHVVGKDRAGDIADAVKPEGAKNLLDVGGASGTYTMAFLRAAPGMEATLFDRPAVMSMARDRLSQAGLLDRVTLAPGDFYRDEFPPGHDLALVSAIIHQNSPEQNRDLYGKVFHALAPGGRIVIRDHVMENDRTAPKEGAVFAVNMLVATDDGRTYTYDEIRDGLTRAGFHRIKLIRKGEHMDGLVEAFKP